VTAMLADIEIADQRHAGATSQAFGLWEQHWPDDVLTSIPGLGPVCASAIRGWWETPPSSPRPKPRSPTPG
jgi:hypothetical protein